MERFCAHRLSFHEVAPSERQKAFEPATLSQPLAPYDALSSIVGKVRPVRVTVVWSGLAS